jgi:hypothetical protein
MRRILAVLAGALAALPGLAATTASVKQVAMPATATTQDFTTTACSSTNLDAALFAFTRGVTSNTIAEEGMLSVGALDSGGDEWGVSHHAKDNQGTASDARFESSTTQPAVMADAATNDTIAEGTGSVLSNGARITWTDINAQELINALMLCGDGEANIVSATLNGTTDVTVSHGLANAPHLIVAVNPTASGNSSGGLSTGFCDVAGSACGTYRATTLRRGHNAATTQDTQVWVTDAIAAELDNTSIIHKVTINDIDSDSFDVVASAATTDVVYFLVIRIPSVDVKVGDFTTQTSSTTSADITGMSNAPIAAVYLTTFLSSSTAADTVVTTTNSESFGIGFAANNSGTEQAATAYWEDDNVSLAGVSDTKSLTSGNRAGIAFNGSGALGYAFSIQSWDSGGITHNYNSFDGTARRVLYAAIAPDDGGAAASFGTSPTVTAETEDTYTVSYNTDNATNFFLAAVKKDSAACTCDDMEANTCAGEVAYATEAATNADDTLALFIPGGDPFPVYDLKSCAEGAGGDSAVANLDDETLDVPTGYQYVVKSGSPGVGELGLFDGASPAIANEDYMHAVTHCDSFANGAEFTPLTLNADSTYILDTLGDTTRQACYRRFYDVSVGDWSDSSPVLYCVNNQVPSYAGSDLGEGEIEYLFVKDEPDFLTLDELWSDAESDALTHEVDNIPSGGTEDGETLTFEFDTFGYYPTVTMRAIDVCLDEEEEVVEFVVGVRVPDVLAFSYPELQWMWQAESIFVTDADNRFHFGN